MLAGVDDVRATWLNPAGLAWVLEASVMGEVVIDRTANGTLHLGQYTLGMNSRGLSFAFLRDRAPDSASVSIFRFGLAMPFPRGSLGLAVSLYSGLGQDEGLDLGVRYGPLTRLDLALVARNLSRPVVRAVRLPRSAALGATWSPVPQILQLAAEGEAIERSSADGYEGRYRGVLQLATSGSRLGVIFAADLDRDWAVARWTLGVQIGGVDRAGLFGSATPVDNLGRLDRMSAVGVASRRAAALVR